MSRKIVIPQLMHVGVGSLGEVARLLHDHHFDTGRVCVGSGDGPSLTMAHEVIDALRSSGVDVVHTCPLHGRLEQVAATAATIIEEDITLAVAVGGGRVIDTIKLAAARTRTDFVTVPTAISHDGISSPVSSITGKDGRRRSYAAAMPAGIVVDLGVIAEAPTRTLRAGIGDLVSNLTAVLDWKLADRVGRDHFDAFAAMIAESAARPALDIVELDSAETHEVVAKGLLLSGLAMAAAGTSRPCSGGEHLISHSLDAMLGEAAAMHGEQVALGSLVTAAAHRSPLLETLQRLYADLGLPRHPQDLGLSMDQLAEAMTAAPVTRPERHTVLSELGDDPSAVSAILELAFPAVAARS